MGVLSTLRNRFFGSYENPATPLSGPDDWLLETSNTKAGVVVNHKKSLGYPPLWRAVSLISGDVAKVPLMLYKRTEDNGRERAKEHPSYHIVRRKVNRWVTAYTLKKLLTFNALWYGNGYALIVRNGGGEIDSLIPIDPTVMVIAQDRGEVWYVPEGVKNNAGKQVKYKASDILHIKGMSQDGLVGVDVISVMREALGLGIAAREFGTRFFGSGANATGFLMIPSHFKEEAQKNLLKNFSETVTGIAKSHKVGLLQDGVKFQPLTAEMKSSQFLETRQFEVREVANIIGVPPHKLGDPTRTAFASLEQENQSYLQECLDNWLCTWEDECFDKLLSEEEKRADSHYFEFTRKALISMDATTESTVLHSDLNNGVRTLNEVRAINNLPPVKGGELLRIPLNMGLIDEDGNYVTIGAEETEPEIDEAEEVETEGDAEEDKMEGALENLLQEKVGRMVNIERNKVTQAAGRDGNFLEFLGTFYEQQAGKMTDAISPIVDTIGVHFNTSETDTAHYVSHHCQTAEQNLVELSGSCKNSDELKTTVTSYFEEDRSSSIVNQIIEGVKNEEITNQ